MNRDSGVPIYLQIVHQIKAAAASGALRSGDALPAIRRLSEELRVNRNTVAKAYSELRSLGVIDAPPGRGCFLRENHSALKEAVRCKLLTRHVDHVVVQAYHLQISRQELLKLMQQRFLLLDRKRRSHEELK